MCILSRRASCIGLPTASLFPYLTRSFIYSDWQTSGGTEPFSDAPMQLRLYHHHFNSKNTQENASGSIYPDGSCHFSCILMGWYIRKIWRPPARLVDQLRAPLFSPAKNHRIVFCWSLLTLIPGWSRHCRRLVLFISTLACLNRPFSLFVPTWVLKYGRKASSYFGLTPKNK